MLTQTEFISAVAKESGLSQKEVHDVLDASVKVTAEAINSGDTVCTPFGRFSTKTKAGRKGVNPFTGQEMIVPTKKVVAYKPVPYFRTLINS